MMETHLVSLNTVCLYTLYRYLVLGKPGDTCKGFMTLQNVTCVLKIKAVLCFHFLILFR